MAKNKTTGKAETPAKKATPATPVRKSDWEIGSLKGKVKQLMLITYHASLKDGEVVQGKIDAGRPHDSKNKITWFNEKGFKTKQERYGSENIEVYFLRK